MYRIGARWVAPVAGPVIENGVVSIQDGRITALDTAGPAEVDEWFTDAVIVPGLVNAHTHLDLTGATGSTPPGKDFPAWLESVIRFRQARTEIEVAGDIRTGMKLSVEAGTALVGDIRSVVGADHSNPPDALHVVPFRELIGLGAARADAAIDAARLAPAISPHAPYSFRHDRLPALPRDKPLAIHLAESAEEMQLLATHSGSLRGFLQRVGAWDPSGLAPSVSAIIAALSARGPTILVHGNYLDPGRKLPANVSIVWCPRTHAAFGHPPHPFRGFIERGVNVALGTDSLASNPDLSILNEARFLYRGFPAADALLRMITVNGAIALGLAGTFGSLELGRPANLTVVAIPRGSRSPVQDLFAASGEILRVVIDGAPAK